MADEKCDCRSTLKVWPIQTMAPITFNYDQNITITYCEAHKDAFAKLLQLRAENERLRAVERAARYLSKSCHLGLVPTMGGYGNESWNSGDDALKLLTQALQELDGK